MENAIRVHAGDTTRSKCWNWLAAALQLLANTKSVYVHVVQNHCGTAVLLHFVCAVQLCIPDPC